MKGNYFGFLYFQNVIILLFSSTRFIRKHQIRPTKHRQFLHIVLLVMPLEIPIRLIKNLNKISGIEKTGLETIISSKEPEVI